MNPALSVIGAGLDIMSSLGSQIYNTFTSERDFAYQKELQDRIFQREDTAVQRRVADLEAAGLNPNLAAGSAAGAGAVVGRSSTPQQNYGGFLDALQAANQIALQTQETRNKQKEYQILDADYQIKARQNYLDEINTYHQMGFDVQPFWDSKTDSLKFDFSGKGSDYTSEGFHLSPQKVNLFFDNIDNQSSYLKNSADMLQKNIDWYNFNQIMGAITDVGSLAMPKFNFSKRVK